MKLAFPMDAAGSPSAHFGQCEAFLVLEVVETRVVGRELRPNDQAHGHAPGAHLHGRSHGHDHAQFVALLKDCAAVIALGIGPGARQSLEGAGIGVHVLEQPLAPEAAARRYAEGRLMVRNPTTCGGCSRSPA